MDPRPAPADELRQALVDRLKADNVLHDPRVEAAFRAVPRHLFLPGLDLATVYSDQAIPTKYLDGVPISSSSQPAIMAIMLEQLGLAPGQRVLEIGAGTGYNAALLAHIVGADGHVTTIDIDEDIVAGARAHLAAAGYAHVLVLCGDGWEGYASGAPYDRIILTVGSQDITPAWRAQLGPGGRLVLPLNIREVQKVVAFEPAGDHLVSVSLRDGGFMMLRSPCASPAHAVRVGPELGLVFAGAGGGIDAEDVYRLLGTPGRDLPTGIRAVPREVWGGITLWLALHDPRFCGAFADKEAAARGIIPPLCGAPGKYHMTWGLYTPGRLCLLIPPAGPGPDFLSPGGEGPEIELFVRSFGPDDTLAAALVATVQSWAAAGRLATAGLRIRAYPVGVPILPTASPIIQAAVTQIVLDWPASTPPGA